MLWTVFVDSIVDTLKPYKFNIFFYLSTVHNG